MPPPSKQRSNATYRGRLKAHKNSGFCGSSLSCKEVPQGHTYCQSHRDRKNQSQRARRAGTNTLPAQDNDLDETHRLSSSAQAAAITPFPYAPNASWEKLIWVSFPDTKPLNETATLAIQVFFEDRESLGHDPWLRQASSMVLRNTVVSMDGEGSYIHQGLVTLLATKAKVQTSFSVDTHTWDWLTQQLESNLLLSSCTDENEKPLRSVLFLHWTTDEPTNPTLDSVYSAVRLLKHIHPASFRVYPNEEEAQQEMNKLGDIRALDDIAQSSRPEFSYRPRTCFGHGPCQLRDHEQTVHKRTQSGCAAHVHICKPSVADRSVHWFYQEFVPSLPRCEFRVFIATEPDKKGLRHRIGKVIAIAKTSFNKDTQALAVREFLAEDLEPELKPSDLVRFALFIFESLRARPDSTVVFESLEVGVRLDIGVADMETIGKSFFVNEITRWYGAHYFSHNVCAEPKTQICKAFGSAFSDFLNVGM
ncbi:uncharacterized protein SETTUDRAFT_151673 [Exserohilum turcica Et28A]|uniref:Uncharacterized protein n=1 Tax=Exserohilum turcicum (strain 28A) TaxID=671987 RepID=R0JY94_EXST2|nr:uncharacterized protein SETTUDRAFT_151673 [Exserohilum turcica Et28A]EOA85888.1 hypothetical protein SETTUDRAFT_151673 [Exserohilum turcica Et28A]